MRNWPKNDFWWSAGCLDSVIFLKRFWYQFTNLGGMQSLLGSDAKPELRAWIQEYQRPYATKRPP